MTTSGQCLPSLVKMSLILTPATQNQGRSQKQPQGTLGLVQAKLRAERKGGANCFRLAFRVLLKWEAKQIPPDSDNLPLGFGDWDCTAKPLHGLVETFINTWKTHPPTMSNGRGQSRLDSHRVGGEKTCYRTHPPLDEPTQLPRGIWPSSGPLFWD